MGNIAEHSLTVYVAIHRPHLDGCDLYLRPVNIGMEPEIPEVVVEYKRVRNTSVIKASQVKGVVETFHLFPSHGGSVCRRYMS